MRILMSALLLSGCLSLSGCGILFLFDQGVRGSGIPDTETREIESFDSVALTGVGTMNVRFGSEEALTITADDNLLPLIDSKVENGRLKLGPTEGINPQSGLVYELTVKNLKALDIAGAPTIKLDGAEGQSLEINLSGASKISGNGKVTDLEIAVSGASSVDLKELQAESVVVKVSGAGSVEVFASASLDAKISGAASVTCHGNPSQVEKSVSGVGSVDIVD